MSIHRKRPNLATQASYVCPVQNKNLNPIEHMKTGIIIPCYNEEKRLNQEAFIHFIQTHDDYHLCFVNDGSNCLLYTSPSPRDLSTSRMPSSA